MKNYYTKRIVILLFSVAVLLIATRKLLLSIVPENEYEQNLFLYQGIVKLILLIITIWIIKKDKLINWEFTHKNIFRSGLVIALLLYFSLQHTQSIVAEFKVSVSNFNMYTYILQCLTTGFFEEFFFRILIFSYVCNAFHTKSKENNYKTVLTTSFLFAITHLTNLFNDEMDAISVINQMMFAFIIGIFFHSIFFRINNIFLISILHSVVNFNGMIKSKLFKIGDHSIEASTSDDFIQSFITFIIVGLVIVFPVLYFGLKNKNNVLIKEGFKYNQL